MTYQLLSNKACGFIYSTNSETNGNMFGSVRQFPLVRYCNLPSAVWYQVRYGVVRCIHLVTPIKLHIIFDLRSFQKQEQDLLIGKDPVLSYRDFFISDAYARHKSVFCLFVFFLEN